MGNYKKTQTVNNVSEIVNDLKHIKETFVSELSIQAENDMIDSQKQIVRNFYSSHNPSSYSRNFGFRKTIESHRHYCSGDFGMAYIKVSSSNIDSDYKSKYGKESVFDLFWNKGVRGLPKNGNSALAHSFTTFGGIHFNEGDTWVNPYWSGESDPYHNNFRTTVKVGKNKTKTPMVPNKLMEYVVSNWWELNGLNKCIEIENKIK